MLSLKTDQKKLDYLSHLFESVYLKDIVERHRVKQTAELEELEAACHDAERPFSLINGSCKRLDEYEKYEDSVTLIQYAAGSLGLNLQKASKIVYFTLPERSDLFEQSKKRTHRIGQERPCFYWIMMCKGSVEEQIYQTLQERKDWTDQLFEEVYEA